MMDPIQRIDLEDVKRIGIAAAYQAGDILQAKFGKISQVRKKGAIDLVTEADTASEEHILQVIHSRFPDHGILAEESGRNTVASAYTWIIDPLDGTTTTRTGTACMPFRSLSQSGATSSSESCSTP